MQITFYRSRLCPRCHMAGKYLQEIVEKDPSILVTEIEITSQPLKIWRLGIHMIPALQINRQILSGLYLTKEKIKQFIQHSKSTPQTKA